MPFTRRRFLEATAAASALTALGDALSPREAEAAADVRWVPTMCRYCGTGCGVHVGVKEGKVSAVRGTVEEHNGGLLCMKGLTLPQVVNSRDRLLHPLVRRNGSLVQATWDEALDLVAERFQAILRQHGPDALGFFGSAQPSTEEVYVANKLFKAGLRSNNVEGTPRFCVASSRAGYVTTYGQDPPLGCYEDFDHADTFLIVGSNLAAAHPVLFRRMMRRKRKNPDTRIVVLDPRSTATTRAADLHLSLTPGTDMVVLNALARLLFQEDLVDEGFLAEHAVFGEGTAVGRSLADYRAFLEAYTPEHAASVSGCRAEDLVQVARWFGERGRNSLSLWCQGVNQRTTGTFTNNLIHNLHLVTGKIGRPGSAPFSLTGQPCAGARDLGAMSNLLPYGRLIANDQDRAEVERLWKVPPGTLRPQPGAAAIDMFQALADGRLKGLYVMCANPGQTLPNVERYRKALANRDAFLVVADAFHPTRTTEFADVVLPAAFWVEKQEGVYGCSDRRYHLLRQAVKPPGEARSDFDILMDLGRRLGFAELLPYRTPADVWAEILTLCKGTNYDFSGITRERLRAGETPQWPLPQGDHPGTPRLYVKGEDPLVPADAPSRLFFYGRPDGKAVVWLRPPAAPAEVVDADYPFYLITGRDINHWHSDTMTRNCAELRKAGQGESRACMHPGDASRLGAQEGSLVRLASRRGEQTFRVSVHPDVRPGTIFVNMHDPDRMCNRLTSDAVDPLSMQPAYKACAVRATPAGPG